MVDGIFITGRKVDTARAKRIAEQFETAIITERPENEKARYFVFDKTGLSYISAGQELKGDFTRLLSRVTGGHLQHEILLKAAGIKAGEEDKLRAVDATAGLGEDSFILAAGGYRVELFEHNPVMAVLLNDALIRARILPELSAIAKRMTLHPGESKELLKTLQFVPDLVYLDPMFPEKKKSAETKKKLQIFHQLEMPAEDEKELLEAAIATGSPKIIIKRPPEGPDLAGVKPSWSVVRKAVRFDCIVSNQNNEKGVL